MWVFDQARDVADERSAWSGEALRRRAQFLPEQDRRIVDLSLSGRATVREMAQLLGLGPGTLSRRVWRLGKLLHDPVVVALLERRRGLREEYRQLGIEHFLHKRNIRQLADGHGMSVYGVRRALDYIRGWAKGGRSE